MHNNETGERLTVRWLVDDAVKYVQRAARRGETYHGIALDPRYGRAQTVNLENDDHLASLVACCQRFWRKIFVCVTHLALTRMYATGSTNVLSRVQAACGAHHLTRTHGRTRGNARSAMRR